MESHLIDLTATKVYVYEECKQDTFCLINTYKYFKMEVHSQTNNVKQEVHEHKSRPWQAVFSI